MDTFDEVIYSADFQLDGAHLVEASAGTGKTYNIQNIYARLIMERGLKVSEILVMTYTDAATKELHDRLHVVLCDLQCRLAEPQKDCPGRDQEEINSRNKRADALIGCAPDRDKARMNVELALLEFDKSSISTIHGFCQRILSRYTFETGVNFTQKIEDNKTAELNALTEDWWRTHRAEIPAEWKLVSLQTWVRKLSGKPDHRLVNGTPNDKKDKQKEGDKLKIADELARRYAGERGSRKALNFDDLLLALRDALKADKTGSSALIAQLRKEYKAALIDEFQDTDPVQYEIFERIFLNGNQNPLFFVGDPKQAIYAFRGGDIFTYLTAKRTPGLQIFPLSVNHRSTRRMIDAVNGMFRDCPDTKTFGHELIGYENDVCWEKEPKIKGASLERPLQIVRFPVKESPSVTSCMPQVLKLMTKRILELLNMKSYNEEKKAMVPTFSPGDIAILTNSNSRNLEIQQALREANIPSVVRKSGNVFSSPAARELWIFLRAIANPSDNDAVCCSMTTVFGGHPLFSGQKFDDPDLLAQFVSRFRELNRQWRTRGLAALAAELEKSEYRKRLAEREDGERQLSDISQLWELCFSAVRQLGVSPEKLVSWLERRINSAPVSEKKGGDARDNDESDKEEYSRELESDEDAVKIMTVHVAKGLQFPVVFLPDCWSISPRSEKPYEFHQDDQLFFSVEEADKALAKQEGMLEKTRLLYVAMTRAIQQMVIFVPTPSSQATAEKSGEIEKKVASEPLTPLLNNLTDRCSANPPYEIFSPEECLAVGEYAPIVPEVQWNTAAKPPKFTFQPSKGSFSSLFHAKSGSEDPDGEDRDELTSEPLNDPGKSVAEHPIFRIRSGADVGSCWHRILEKIPFDATDEDIRSSVAAELAGSGFPASGETLDVTAEMIRRTLHWPLNPPAGENFSLSRIPWPDRLSEQNFDFASAGAASSTGVLKQILRKYWENDPSKAEFLQAVTGSSKVLPHGFMTGIADLIFRYQGFYYIIDWKSNAIGGEKKNFSLSGIRGEMAKYVYFFQYLLYAVVLHHYLKQTLKSNYSWEKNFGGVRYFFLRGIAADCEAPVFEDRPPEAMLDELGRALGLSEGK